MDFQKLLRASKGQILPSKVVTSGPSGGWSSPNIPKIKWEITSIKFEWSTSNLPISLRLESIVLEVVRSKRKKDQKGKKARKKKMPQIIIEEDEEDEENEDE